MCVPSYLSLLSCHTLRFDFTGCGHSNGQWEYGNYESDYVDLQHLIKFLQQDLHCEVACIVGHSQGSAAILRNGYDNSNASGSMHKYNLRGSPQPSPPLYINLSRRCFGINDVDYKNTFSEQQCHELETRGRFTIARRGPTRNFGIAMEAIANCNQYDATYYAKGINAASTSTSTTQYPSSPSKIHVLSVHGDADETVPVENAYMFKQLLSPKECHEISIIDEGNHNFAGAHRIHEVVTSITAFVKKYRSSGGSGSGGVSGGMKYTN